MKHTNTCHVLSVCTERGMHHCSFDTKKALLCRPALNLLCYSIRQLCSYPPFLPTAFRWFAIHHYPLHQATGTCCLCPHVLSVCTHRGIHGTCIIALLSHHRKSYYVNLPGTFPLIHTRINSVAPIPLLLPQLQVVLLFTTTPYTKRQERAACVPMF